MENGVFFFRNLVNLPICKYFGSVVVVMGGGGGGGMAGHIIYRQMECPLFVDLNI